MTEQNKDTSSNTVSLGKHWAALRGSNVIGVISMRVPNDIDFDDYREKAKACLALLGDIKSGEIEVRDGKKYFVQRMNHANRGKQPRVPKEYLMR